MRARGIYEARARLANGHKYSAHTGDTHKEDIPDPDWPAAAFSGRGKHKIILMVKTEFLIWIIPCVTFIPLFVPNASVKRPSDGT